MVSKTNTCDKHQLHVNGNFIMQNSSKGKIFYEVDEVKSHLIQFFAGIKSEVL